MLSRLRSDAGVGVVAFLIALGSLLVGGAAAAGAVGTVIQKYGPADGNAVQNGPKQPLPPGELLGYGG
jgi:hypothetical protein